MKNVRDALSRMDEPGYPFSEWVGSDVEECGLVEEALIFLEEHPDATSSNFIDWLADQDKFIAHAIDNDDD